MTRLFILTLFASSFFAFSCKSKDENGQASKNNTVSEKTVKEEETETAEPVAKSSDVSKAAVGYCECFNANFKNIDPKIQQIVVKASNSDNPVLVLQNEMASIGGPNEQKRLGEQLQKFSDSKSMNDCSKRIEKDYNLDKNNPNTQRLVLNALEENRNCELVAAFMRMGIKQSEANKNKTGTSGQ